MLQNEFPSTRPLAGGLYVPACTVCGNHTGKLFRKGQTPEMKAFWEEKHASPRHDRSCDPGELEELKRILLEKELLS